MELERPEQPGMEAIMQIPTVDRSAPRPAGSDGGLPVTGRTASSTPDSITPGAPATAGVVNDINPAVHSQAGSSTSDSSTSGSKADPLQGGSDANTNKDWTQRKDATTTGTDGSSGSKALQTPPKPPLSKVLMDNLQAAWTASAKVVDIWMQNNPSQNPTATQQVQAQTQVTNRIVDPLAAPGEISKQALTYTPQQVKKTEKTQ